MLAARDAAPGSSSGPSDGSLLEVRCETLCVLCLSGALGPAFSVLHVEGGSLTTGHEAGLAGRAHGSGRSLDPKLPWCCQACPGQGPACSSRVLARQGRSGFARASGLALPYPPPPPTHTHTHPTPTTPTTHPPPPPPPPLPPCVLWLLLDSLAVQEMVEAAGPGWVRRAKHIRGCLEEGGACEVCTVVSRSAGQAGPVAKCCRAARATSDDAACKPSLPDARRLQPTSPLLCPVRLSWQVVRVLFVTPCAHLQCVDCTFKSVQQAPACAKCGTPYKMQAGVVQSCCRDFVRPGLYIRAAWCLVERCRCLLWRAWGRGRRGGGEGPRIACRRLHTLGHF